MTVEVEQKTNKQIMCMCIPTTIVGFKYDILKPHQNMRDLDISNSSAHENSHVPCCAWFGWMD